jgi:hypothetical protein
MTKIGFFSNYADRDQALNISQNPETLGKRGVQTPNKHKISLKNYLKQPAYMNIT